MLAIDASGNAASNASGQIFAPTDASASTPLSPVDLFGLPFPGDDIVASSLGILPAFRINGFTAVDWVSGGFRISIPCIDQVPTGGATGTYLKKKSGSNYDVEWVAGTSGGGVDDVTAENIPPGSILYVRKSGSTWPARPTSRADVIVIWLGADPKPAIVSSGTGGMRNNVDLRFVTP